MFGFIGAVLPLVEVKCYCPIVKMGKTEAQSSNKLSEGLPLQGDVVRVKTENPSVQFSCSVVSDSLRSHRLQHARLPCPSPTPGVYLNSRPLSRDAIQPSHPLSSPSPPAFNLSQHQGLFQWVISSYQVAFHWSFSFSISPSNEYSGLISFRTDWLDLLAVQGTLKSLLQYHSSKASILWCSAFFIVQISHPYMITGKTIALTRQTVVDKVMSLLFNMLSRLNPSVGRK